MAMNPLRKSTSRWMIQLNRLYRTRFPKPAQFDQPEKMLKRVVDSQVRLEYQNIDPLGANEAIGFPYKKKNWTLFWPNPK